MFLAYPCYCYPRRKKANYKKQKQLPHWKVSRFFFWSQHLFYNQTVLNPVCITCGFYNYIFTVTLSLYWLRYIYITHKSSSWVHFYRLPFTYHKTSQVAYCCCCYLSGQLTRNDPVRLLSRLFLSQRFGNCSMYLNQYTRTLYFSHEVVGHNIVFIFASFSVLSRNNWPFFLGCRPILIYCF